MAVIYVTQQLLHCIVCYYHTRAVSRLLPSRYISPRIHVYVLCLSWLKLWLSSVQLRIARVWPWRYTISSELSEIAREISKISGERFGVDNAMLSRLLGFFQRYRHQLASDLYHSIASATHSLKEKLWTLRSKLRPIEAGMTWKRIAWRVKKGDVISAANDLERWTVRLSLLVNLLPAQLREVLALDFASVDFNADDRRSSLLQSLLMKQHHEKDLGRTLADFRSLQCRPDYGDQRIREYDGESWMMLMTEYMRRTGLKKLIELDMARLVSLLSRSDVRTMHLPEALCHYEQPTEVSDPYVLLKMVYRKPQNVDQICSLSWLLKQGFTRVCQTCYRPVRGPSGMRTSLTQRVDLARDITSAVAFLHSTGWVHKNIRTQRIMLCRYAGQKQFSLSSVTVAGFSFSRYCEDEAHSLGADGGNWRSDIYKHPERQDEYIDTDPRPLFDAGKSPTKALCTSPTDTTCTTSVWCCSR